MKSATKKAKPTRERGATPLARLRKICLALPEGNEKISHGEPTWFAGKGKVFAMLDNHHHGAEHLAVWLPQPLGRQEDLIESDPDLFFRPPYVGPSGWVGVVLNRNPDWGMVASLIEEAYRFVARPKLIAQLDAGLAGGPVNAGEKSHPRQPGRRGRRPGTRFRPGRVA